jgi:hypothetical protein
MGEETSFAQEFDLVYGLICKIYGFLNSLTEIDGILSISFNNIEWILSQTEFPLKSSLFRMISFLPANLWNLLKTS